MPTREPELSVDVLREAVRLRVAHSSLRLAAREIGISHAALRAFLNGTEPYGKNEGKLREWYGRETNEVLRLRLALAECEKRVQDLEAELKRK